MLNSPDNHVCIWVFNSQSHKATEPQQSIVIATLSFYTFVKIEILYFKYPDNSNYKYFDIFKILPAA